LIVGSDLIKHAKFQVNQFGVRSPRGRKWPSFIDLEYRPYNSVCTNLLHCDATCSESCCH